MTIMQFLLASAPPMGQQAYTAPGTYTWTAPEGVTLVSVVCVGAGGGGAWTSPDDGDGGGGGGLGWKNDIPVVPGNTYTVVVGSPGLPDSSTGGGQSYFISNTTVAGFGGSPGAYSDEWTPAPGGGYYGDGGGSGGSGGCSRYSNQAAGGGGAGGYSGNGGHGATVGPSNTSMATAGTGGAGGGGDGGNSSVSAPGIPGGGVGIYGEGESGAAGGGGGSGGAGTVGSFAVDPLSGYEFGSGGGGSRNYTGSKSAGGPGAVRIIWGQGRAFPSTGTGDI